ADGPLQTQTPRRGRQRLRAARIRLHQPRRVPRGAAGSRGAQEARPQPTARQVARGGGVSQRRRSGSGQGSVVVARQTPGAERGVVHRGRERQVRPVDRGGLETMAQIKRSRLFTRVLLGLLGIFAASAALSAGLAAWHLSGVLDQQYQSKGDAIARTIAN